MEEKNAYTYDAFGSITNAEELARNRYTYNGEQYDQVVQQYYLRARSYNPLAGRFTQEDVYRGDGLNLYVYCNANSLMYIDPSGYTKKSVNGKRDSSNGSRLPVDKNGNIIFYHGTTAEAASSIRNNGVDLKYATRDMDFGRGFYVTTDAAQAEIWATRQGNKATRKAQKKGKMNFVDKGEKPRGNGQQTTFITNESIELLNKYMKGKVG